LPAVRVTLKRIGAMHIHSITRRIPLPAQDLAPWSFLTTVLQIFSAIVGTIGEVNTMVVILRAKNAGT
jgi:hypothetical protein